jgi:hypothetical protein
MALMNPMTMVMRNQATQGFAFGGMVNAARMQRAMQMAAQQQAMGGGRYNKMLGALRRVPGMAGYAAPAPQQAPAPMPMNPGEAYAQQPARLRRRLLEHVRRHAPEDEQHASAASGFAPAPD